MYTFLSVIIIVISVLLVLIVLIQNSKGGGLAANFAAGNQIFGVRQTADKLEKFTWGLAIALLVTCFAATAVMPRQGSGGGSAVQQQMQGVQTGTPNNSMMQAPQEQQPTQQQPSEQAPATPQPENK